MLKALALLAASMFAGTLLLSAIEPNENRSNHKPGVLLHASGIPAQRNPGVTHWEQVLVICAADAERKDDSGNAIEIKKDTHMRISPDGRLQINAAWDQGRLIEGFDHTLVVCLEPDPALRCVTGAQRQTLSQLISRLRQDFHLAPRHIRYESLYSAIPDLRAHLQTGAVRADLSDD